MNITIRQAFDPERAEYMGGTYSISVAFDDETDEEITAAFTEALAALRARQTVEAER